MALAVVAGVVVVLVLAVVFGAAIERGPSAGDVAVAYELAWDRLDFEALWALSGAELRDGLDRKEYVRAKAEAYRDRRELAHLVRELAVDKVTKGTGYAVARTRATLHDGSVVRNDVQLARRGGTWVVIGYQLAKPNPSNARS